MKQQHLSLFFQYLAKKMAASSDCVTEETWISPRFARIDVFHPQEREFLPDSLIAIASVSFPNLRRFTKRT
jgi:hypothetical protein